MDRGLVSRVDDVVLERDGSKDLRFFHILKQDDLFDASRTQTDEHRLEVEKIIETIRLRLDSGLGHQIFDKYRAKETEHLGQNRLLMVGALMMRAGAEIKKEHLQYLRDVAHREVFAPNLGGPTYYLPLVGPAKAQFVAAIDNYQPGTPRDWQEPSCFHCGKVRTDLGKALKNCGRCKKAWYCGVDCQRANWKLHKPECPPRVMPLRPDYFLGAKSGPTHFPFFFAPEGVLGQLKEELTSMGTGNRSFTL
ncbi:hypothetical protein LX32DRAFT_602774 [Colletotrichum zoysiae]|uniref:MYND-type domain-containing protein n=1 Tax=Colletotrichum zoysiae TaxID=1216348 RepID=A0AAD9LY59_9PEZI|nr:hypothetical protein LX32DRAFT_602774 [Colletotrichum zoysiae]